MSSLAQNLRSLRAGKSFTQEQLAERSGLTQPTISQLETGQRTSTTLATLQQLADGLECSVEDLVRDEPLEAKHIAAAMV
jgi:transcriptional regulator with XRE-family HTH domain